MTRCALGVVVILAVASGGCWFKKNKKPLPVPPPPAPQAQPARPPAPAPVPQKPAAQQPVPESAPTEPQVVAPAPKKHKAKPAQPAPATAAPAPESTPQAVPQLGVLMTPEQRQRYEADYAASLARAQHGLVLAAEYKLTPAQSEAVGRIKSFMQLAANVHDRDQATAAQLAHRAGLLAEDLLKTLQ